MQKRLLAAALLVLIPAVALPSRTQFRPGDPLRIVLLIDSSRAMSPMLNSFRAGLRSFLAQLPGEPEIALVTTGGQLRIRVAPTDDRLQLDAAVDRFAPDGGGNAFLNALLEADSRLLKTAPERRSVFVILSSDINASAGGESLAQYNQFLADFVSRGGRAHAIIVIDANSMGLTTQIAQNLTENTGGFFDTVLSVTAVPALMETVAAYVAADQ